MAIDVTVRRSRRSVLAALLGAAAASVAGAIIRPSHANADAPTTFTSAAAGTPAVTAQNTATSGSPAAAILATSASTADNTNVISGTATGASGFSDGVYGETDSTAGNGVYGVATAGSGYTGGVSGESYSSGGVGVWGYTDADSTGTMGVTGPDDPGPIKKTGVYGVATQPNAASRGVVGHVLSFNGVGVTGVSGTASLPAVGRNVGVYGYSELGTGVRESDPSTGVWGTSTAPAGMGVVGDARGGKATVGVQGVSDVGTGVLAVSETTGTAVFARALNAMTGVALRASGRVRFDNAAGIATVTAGTSQVVVTPGTDLATTSAVVATLQGLAGAALVKYVQINPTADTFTIHLTANAPNNVKIAWHVFG